MSGGTTTSPISMGWNKKKRLASQQVQMNPFLIQNITLRDKFAKVETDEARFLKSFERLENTISQAEKVVNIDHSCATASTIAIPRKNHPQDSVERIVPSLEQTGEAYRKLILMTNNDSLHGSSTFDSYLLQKGWLIKNHSRAFSSLPERTTE